MTITFWIKTSQSNVGVYPNFSFILTKDQDGGSLLDWAFGIGSGNKLIFKKGNNSSPTFYQVQSTSAINTDTWRHVAIVNNSTSTKLFIDGVLETSMTNPSFNFSNQLIDLIAGYAPGPARSSYFIGLLDDIFIFNRELSNSEINQIYRYPYQASVLWSNGATSNTTIVSPGLNTTYYATISDGVSTCIDSVKVTISSVDTVVTPLDPTSICSSGGTVRLQAGLGSTYQWLRNNILIPGANTRIYTATQTGSYRVLMSNALGCSDTSRSIQMSFYPQPLPAFTINNSTQCLSGNNFVFTNTSTITPGTLSYNWNLGNGTTSTATNPTVSYAAAGTYTVTLIATSNSGCIDSVRQNVIVNSNASGSISTPTSTIICEGSSVTLSASGGTTYQWALNATNIAGATNPTYSATLPGVYSVQINNASGCSGTSSNTITLSLIRRPTADFTSTGSCASFPVIFTNQSTVANSGIVSYSWAFGNGNTSTNINPTTVYTSSGTYNATLVVTPQACPALSSSITKPISVINATPNQRYPSVNAIVNRNLQLQARTLTGASYQWIPPSGLNNATIVNPIFNSNRQQEYLIKISTPDGCVVTDTLLVRIFDGRGIYLPKGFTPNGDGNNDKLTPRLVGISRLIFFKVYDRWGQLMYQTSIAGEGWDGTFKGVKQPIETYTWVAEGIDIDGNTIRETGNSMLLR
jgi:gliding motility-associated-like protein